jgi:hypothetical protein
VNTVEKIRELAQEHGLAEEIRALMERVHLNSELPEEEQLSMEEMGVWQTMAALSEEEREKFAKVNSELVKFYRRSLKENEAWVEHGNRAIEAIERARDLEPDKEIHTVGEAMPVFEAHGIEAPFSEEELKMEVEVVTDEDFEDAAEWAKVPASEVPTDENGIPTGRAAQHGFGIEDHEGNLIKLYPAQISAMRASSKHMTYKGFVEEHLEDAAQMKQEMLNEISEAIHPLLPRLSQEHGGPDMSPEHLANQLVAKSLRETYMLTLATMVREYPRDPRGIIDYHKGKETKAAQRYKDFISEKYIRPMVMQVADELRDEAVEAGVMEVFTGEDGKEYIKLLPGYDEWSKKRQAELEEEED